MTWLMASPLNMFYLNYSSAKEWTLYFLPSPLALAPDLVHSGYQMKVLTLLKQFHYSGFWLSKSFAAYRSRLSAVWDLCLGQLLVLFRHLAAPGLLSSLFKLLFRAAKISKIANQINELFYSCRYSKKGFVVFQEIKCNKCW